ncbi:FKBP-type peptidyl-prolyl cis-trans isomerase FkpA precursor [hydrothermal vent metagenome]|uniref:peptidylprolyl isomerase n=1 Tax=hydrothermal vent metagenome TaxID=652676 RepID=A0A3B1DII1_9ZZZZ
MSKHLLFSTLLFALMVSPTVLLASDISIKKSDLKTNKDKISYYVGMTLGNSTRKAFAENKNPLDVDSLLKGAKDFFQSPSKTALSQREMAKQITNYLGGSKNFSKEKVSYYYGIDMMQTIMKSNSWKKSDLNSKILLVAFKRAYEKDVPVLSQQEGFNAIVEFSRKEIAKTPVKVKLVVKNEYLAKNAKKKGVIVTKSGLQYKIIKKGKGPSPKIRDFVRVHYEGKFTNGEVFDSSLRRGQPASLPLNGVIKGWTEVLQLMKVGDKWTVTIPSELAYGKQRTRGIPANSVLIFEIELLGIKKK